MTRPAVRRRPAPSPMHRRRRRVAVLVAGLVLLALVGVGLRVLVYDSGLAEVEDVEVTGAATVPVPAVLAAAAVVPGGPLADVDTLGIARRIATVPGVASVRVGRAWPHTVTVEVTERVPVAVVQTPAGLNPVDGTGVVYGGVAPAGLPRLALRGVGPDDPSTRAALVVLAALPDAVRPQVQTVSVAADGGTQQVSLGLTGGREVRWGMPDRSPEKAAVLVAVLTQQGRVYDVTSPELPTVGS